MASGGRPRATGDELAQPEGMNANPSVSRRLARQGHRRAFVAAMERVAAVGLLVVCLRGIQALVQQLGLWLVACERLVRRVVGCP